jgi:hypothetical protein
MPPRRAAQSSPGNGDIFIPPRGPDETAYAYRKRRTLALFGQTPYERRIALARQRGIGVTAARGHAPASGETESQRRNRLSVEQYGQTVSQRRRAELTQWLEEHGYTPDATNMTWTQLIRLAARLRYMYGGGGTVTPDMIAEAIDLEHDEFLESGWAFERLWAKYDDMVAYREYRDREPGKADWAEYLQVHPFIPSLAPQWWYYH